MADDRSVLRAVVDTVPNGILVVDDDRNFFTYNQQFVDMWDIPDEVVESGDDERALQAVLDELERPDEFLETVEYFYDHPEKWGRDLIHLNDGRIFDRYTGPARGTDGTYFGRIWVFEDITARKRKERQLQRQNDRLEEFASVISHDLRNPLTVAKARVDLVQTDIHDEHLDTVDRALDRMEALIEDLSTLARVGETPSPQESVSIPEVARTAWETVPTADASLDIQTRATITADQSRLRQLLENLFRNAVQHGGEDVTVSVGELDQGFYIEDDGAGLPPEQRDRLFEAGYSTRDSGTGLGLSIVKRICDAHDWDIRAAESTAGGARFEILPESPAGVSARPAGQH